jgi:fibronectin-binding autotransporter adhesin
MASKSFDGERQLPFAARWHWGPQRTSQMMSTFPLLTSSGNHINAFRLLSLGLLICLSLMALPTAHAQTFTKADTTGLTGSSDWSPSWSSVDTTGTMTFTTVLSASNALNLNTNLAVGGTATFGQLYFGTMNGPVVISGAGTLAMTSSTPLDMSAASHDVTIDANFNSGNSPNRLVVGSGRTLTLGGGGRLAGTSGAGTVVYTNGSYGALGGTGLGSGNADAETGGVVFGANASANSNGSFGVSGFVKISGSNASVTLTQNTAGSKNIGSNAVGKVQLSSGTFSVTGALGSLSVGAGAGRGTLDVTGGIFSHTASDLLIARATTSGTASGELKMSGGLATAQGIVFGSGTSSNGTGRVTLNGGRLELGANGITNSGTTGFAYDITLNSGTVAAYQNWSSGLNMKLGSGLTFDAAKSGTSFNISLSGELSNSGAVAGGFTKIGSGTLTLSGSNSFSGETTINAGSLVLGANGSFTSSPTITVGGVGSTGAVLDLTAKSSGFTFGSGQTVKGIGTIQMSSGNALTINGTLAAGNSPGTLTIEGGDLVLGGSSTTQYEINGTDNTVGGGVNDLTRVAGSLTLGGTLDVAASPGFDLFGNRTYRVFDYATSGTGALSGSMAIGSTPDANYLYSLNTATLGQVSLFVQRKAEQAAAMVYSQPTSGTVNAFTNTNVSFSGTLANLSPAGGADLIVSLAGNAGDLAVGSLAASSGSSVVAGSSATVTGQISTGTSLGTRTWSVTNTDSGAIGSQTSTANGVVNVFAHGTPTLSGTTIDFGYVLVGTSTSQNLNVSNGTLGSPAANTGGITWTSGTLPGGFTGGGGNSAGVIASGSGATYSFTLATGSAGGAAGSQMFSFADDSSILGNGSLGSQAVSLTGTVLDAATAVLSGGITSGTNWVINLGEHNQGAGAFTQGFSISNLLQTLGYTADLDLLAFDADPLNTNSIGITLSGSNFSTILAGGTNSYQASLSLGAAGSFTNVYNLSFGSSKNGSSLGGTPQNVQLTVQGIIVVPEPGTVIFAGIGMAMTGWSLWKRRRIAHINNK